MTRVLVTGGTGSLGNALVPRLLEDLTIERVIVYSRDEQKQNEMACRIRNDRLAFYLGDVRDRVLTDGEIAEIWAACRNDDFGRIVRLLLLTGQRRDEIGDLQWRELDLDCGVLNLPPERTKNNRPHVVPLAPAAAALLLNDRAAAVVDLTEARWVEVTISHDRHRLWINTEHGLVCRIYGIATLILPDSEG